MGFRLPRTAAPISVPCPFAFFPAQGRVAANPKRTKQKIKIDLRALSLNLASKTSRLPE
jgi:hypothetical protein